MKTGLTLFVFLFLASCAHSPTQGWLDPTMDEVAAANQRMNMNGNSNAMNGAALAGQAAGNAAAQGAMDAGNAASMHHMYHAPAPSGF